MRLSEGPVKAPVKLVRSSVGLQLREVHRILLTMLLTSSWTFGIDFASDRAAVCECNDYLVIFNAMVHFLHVVAPFRLPLSPNPMTFYFLCCVYALAASLVCSLSLSLSRQS